MKISWILMSFSTYKWIIWLNTLSSFSSNMRPAHINCLPPFMKESRSLQILLGHYCNASIHLQHEAIPWRAFRSKYANLTHIPHLPPIFKWDHFLVNDYLRFQGTFLSHTINNMTVEWMKGGSYDTQSPRHNNWSVFSWIVITLELKK